MANIPEPASLILSVAALISMMRQAGRESEAIRIEEWLVHYRAETTMKKAGQEPARLDLQFGLSVTG